MSDVVQRLTRDPRKASLYERETYVRDGLDTLERRTAAGAGDLAARAELEHDAALLVLKPDGLRHGVAETVLDVIEGWGLHVVWADQVCLDRHVWRELWRYQLNVATRRRLDFNEHLFGHPGVLLVLRREPDRPLPASVELASRKGSATLADQPADSLRAHLGQPHRVLSLIHVADEPLDVLRELGLLLDRPRRDAAITAALTDRRVDRERLRQLVAAAAPRLPGGLPPADEAQRRVRAALAQADDVDARSLATLVEQAEACGGLDWVEADPLLSATAAPVDRWDLVAASAAWLVPDDPRLTKTLGGVDLAGWETRPSRST